MRQGALCLLVTGLVMALIQSPLSWSNMVPWVENTIRWGVRFLAVAALVGALFYVAGWVYLTMRERLGGGVKTAKERMTRDALCLLAIGLVLALVQAPLYWMDFTPWVENTIRWGIRFLSIAGFSVGMLYLAARVYLSVVQQLGTEE
jgi:putative copper export protein